MPVQIIQSSPALTLNAPKVTPDRVQVDTRYVISNEDIRRIFDRFGYGNPFRYAIAIGYYTGLRIGEVYALNWDDIDFYNQTINVNKLIYKRYSAG